MGCFLHRHSRSSLHGWCFVRCGMSEWMMRCSCTLYSLSEFRLFREDHKNTFRSLSHTLSLSLPISLFWVVSIFILIVIAIIFPECDIVNNQLRALGTGRRAQSVSSLQKAVSQAPSRRSNDVHQITLSFHTNSTPNLIRSTA